MHALSRVLLGVVQFLVGFGGARVEETAGGGGGRFADRLAVPARAFGVGLAVYLLVSFGGLGKAIVELGLGDFVVVVDELLADGDGVGKVEVRTELVGVPGEVDVQGRHGHVHVIRHDVHKALVLGYEPGHGTG